MRSHINSSNHAARRFARRVSLAIIATGLLLVTCQAASAQCVPNPTGETAVGLQNASSFFLTFYIDEVNKGGVPSGDRSIDFVVTPGEHTLRAEAVIGGETLSVSRTADIPRGHVCTWTVTDPPDQATSRKAQREFQDPLCRELGRAHRSARGVVGRRSHN